jgi:hypothetical protein
MFRELTGRFLLSQIRSKARMIDSPASMSIHEEATPVATRPVMVGFLYVIAFGPGGLGLRSARGSDAAPRHV